MPAHAHMPYSDYQTAHSAVASTNMKHGKPIFRSATQTDGTHHSSCRMITTCRAGHRTLNRQTTHAGRAAPDRHTHARRPAPPPVPRQWSVRRRGAQADNTNTRTNNSERTGRPIAVRHATHHANTHEHDTHGSPHLTALRERRDRHGDAQSYSPSGRPHDRCCYSMGPSNALCSCGSNALCCCAYKSTAPCAL